MIRTANNYVEKASRLPRTRGDDPYMLDGATSQFTFAPHARG